MSCAMCSHCLPKAVVFQDPYFILQCFLPGVYSVTFKSNGNMGRLCTRTHTSSQKYQNSRKNRLVTKVTGTFISAVISQSASLTMQVCSIQVYKHSFCWHANRIFLALQIKRECQVGLWKLLMQNEPNRLTLVLNIFPCILQKDLKHP